MVRWILQYHHLRLQLDAYVTGNLCGESPLYNIHGLQMYCLSKVNSSSTCA